MGDFIRTVTGDILPGDLGYCHGHEHIMVRAGGPYEKTDEKLCIDDRDRSLAELLKFKKAGGSSVVDAQPVGAGRKPFDLRCLSGESGVKIIASTGFHMRRFYPEESRIFGLGSREAEELFVEELTEGMYDGMDPEYDAVRSDIRAGQIKTALSDPGDFGMYESLWEGAIAASRITGAPMMVHTEKGADVPAFLDYLEGKGMDLKKVILCHLDKVCYDMEVHREAAGRGCFLDYDAVARYERHDDKKECEMIREMLDRGFEDSIMLALDVTKIRISTYGGSPGLCFILEKFRDIAAGYGIPGDAFEKFMVENPSMAFGFGN